MTAQEFYKKVKGNYTTEELMRMYAKQLIEKVLPEEKTEPKYDENHPYNEGYNKCLDEFKQNLKKEGVEI